MNRVVKQSKNDNRNDIFENIKEANLGEQLQAQTDSNPRVDVNCRLN